MKELRQVNMSRGNMAQSVITLVNMDCKYMERGSPTIPVTFTLATRSTMDMFWDSPRRLIKYWMVEREDTMNETNFTDKRDGLHYNAKHLHSATASCIHLPHDQCCAPLLNHTQEVKTTSVFHFLIVLPSLCKVSFCYTSQLPPFSATINQVEFVRDTQGNRHSPGYVGCS